MKAGPQRKSKAADLSTTPVARGLLQRKCACGGAAGTESECPECRKKELTLQRKSEGYSGAPDVPPIVHEVLRSPGQPLGETTRRTMEGHFGHDLSRVRIHTDSMAAESAREVDALAYTVGGHVVFGFGQYAPRSKKGQSLLAHELAHAIQQGGEQVTPAHLEVAGKHDPYEGEAEAAADAFLVGRSYGIARSGKAQVDRQAPSGNPGGVAAPADPFVVALQQNPPDFERAYLEFFGRSIDHMIRTLEGIGTDLLELWSNNITPAHPGDDEVSKARVTVTTSAVNLKGKMSLQGFELQGLPISLLLPDQQRKIRGYMAARITPVHSKHSKGYSLSDRGVLFILGPEGFCPNIYDDNTLSCGRGSGNCTIGYGYKIHDGPCDDREEETPFKGGITRDKALSLSRGRADRSASEVDSKVKVEINQCQVDALTDFAYNAGTGPLPELVKSLNEGDYDGMPALIRATLLRGKQGQDLTSRRNKEATLFEQCKY